MRYRSDVCTEHGLRRGRGAGTDLSRHRARGETGRGAAGTGTSQGWRGWAPRSRSQQQALRTGCSPAADARTGPPKALQNLTENQLFA